MTPVCECQDQGYQLQQDDCCAESRDACQVKVLHFGRTDGRRVGDEAPKDEVGCECEADNNKQNRDASSCHVRSAA